MRGSMLSRILAYHDRPKCDLVCCAGQCPSRIRSGWVFADRFSDQAMVLETGRKLWSRPALTDGGLR